MRGGNGTNLVDFGDLGDFDHCRGKFCNFAHFEQNFHFPRLDFGTFWDQDEMWRDHFHLDLIVGCVVMVILLIGVGGGIVMSPTEWINPNCVTRSN